MKRDLFIKSEKITRNKTGKIKRVVFTLSNGTKITAEPCHESWQQWGGTQSELWITIKRVEQLNPEFEREEG